MTKIFPHFERHHQYTHTGYTIKKLLDTPLRSLLFLLVFHTQLTILLVSHPPIYHSPCLSSPRVTDLLVSYPQTYHSPCIPFRGWPLAHGSSAWRHTASSWSLCLPCGPDQSLISWGCNQTSLQCYWASGPGDGKEKNRTPLTHCGIVITYGNIDVGQCWLR